MIRELARLQSTVNSQAEQLRQASLASQTVHCSYFSRKPYFRGPRACRHGFRCPYIHECNERLVVLRDAGMNLTCDRQLRYGFCKHAGNRHM